MTSFESQIPNEFRDSIRKAIDQEELIDLCSRLVQMNSIVENDAAEKEVASFVASHFRTLGLDVRLVDLPHDLVIPDMGKGPHPQVIARLKGDNGKPILLVGGHLDTEPVVDRHLWTHDPFSGHVDRENGFIYGLGTVNMKQSLASFMAAISAIVRSGIRLKGDLVFLGTSQEDLGMIGSRYLATHWNSLDIGPLPDMYFGGDQSDCAAWTCNVGLGLFVITTYGRSAHCSSRYIHHPAYRDSYHVNAADKMLKIMQELKDVRRTFVYERSTFLGEIGRAHV
jgi:acetylornithine deacetylase